MKKNRWQIWGVFMLCLLAACMQITKRAYGQDIPEEIVIDKGVYRTDIYEGVRFTHGTHVIELGIACGNCHHTWNKEESVSPDRCGDCHAPNDKEIIPLRDAYMNNCRGCHGRLKVEGKPSGPTRCNECHRKKKRMR